MVTVLLMDSLGFKVNPTADKFIKNTLKGKQSCKAKLKKIKWELGKDAKKDEVCAWNGLKEEGMG